jgi:hypothetical protein
MVVYSERAVKSYFPRVRVTDGTSGWSAVSERGRPQVVSIAVAPSESFGQFNYCDREFGSVWSHGSMSEMFRTVLTYVRTRRSTI